MAQIELDPYLFFDGNCMEAMEFYKEVFGGELAVQKYEEAPEGAVKEDHGKDMTGKVMHAELKDAAVHVMASDSPFGAETLGSGRISLSLGGTDEEKMTKMFEGLSEGGKVSQPLQKQFWGDTFGMVTDKYDVPWMVNISSKKD